MYFMQFNIKFIYFLNKLLIFFIYLLYNQTVKFFGLSEVLAMNINIIGVPLFYGCDKSGVENGPNALRQSGLSDILTKNNKKVYDLGNLYIENVTLENKYATDNKIKYLSPIADVNTNLAHSVFNSLNSECFPFVIGGDHSLGLGSIAGASKFFGDDFGVIWVDAHGDINTHLTSPSGNVHGMPLASSMGVGHDTLKNIYFKGKKVDPSKVFILCARDLDEGELTLIEELNMSVWTTAKIQEKGVQRILADLLKKITNINNIHLSFDIDCLDSYLVPGTGTPVSEGMNLTEIEEILKGILSTKKIKSMDFVEFNPEIDENSKTLDNCIKLLKTISENL